VAPSGSWNIRLMIETVPLEQAADAYARMIDGKARFRMVLTIRRYDFGRCLGLCAYPVAQMW
jgi:D-arabinose 1-dehydrogenase-like Zn-dependent alcohol dehydrogenase